MSKDREEWYALRQLQHEGLGLKAAAWLCSCLPLAALAMLQQHTRQLQAP